MGTLRSGRGWIPALMVLLVAGCTVTDPNVQPSTSALSSAVTTPSAPAEVAVKKGDCLDDIPTGFAVVQCSDPTADYVLLENLPGATSDCWQVPGVHMQYRHKDAAGATIGVFCAGDVGADPAAGINIAQVGDCVAVGTGKRGRKAPCTEPGAFRVLARFEKVAATRDTCQGIPAATKVQGVRLKREAAQSNPDNVFDAVFCLAPAR
ncbi:hypothetical protein [Nocardia sp. NPDC051832]|uniref:LppU/SCO3897 family protein n=1 Tax=Nocardia sp. NPDC051832 TaxID=3155673 RepID=UPI003446E8FB